MKDKSMNIAAEKGYGKKNSRIKSGRAVSKARRNFLKQQFKKEE